MENQNTNTMKISQVLIDSMYTQGRQQGRIAEYGATKEERSEAINSCTRNNDAIKRSKENGNEYMIPAFEAFVKGFRDVYYSMD